MNKEQQIEEMAEAVICAAITENAKIDDKVAINLKEFIESLYNAGYRKIDENCAVITKDKLKLYKRQAVKKFAEKLKEYPLESKNLVWEYGEGWLDCYKTVKKAIDELLKEYE